MNEAVGRRVGTGTNYPDRCTGIASYDAATDLRDVSSMRTGANGGKTLTMKRVAYSSSSTRSQRLFLCLAQQISLQHGIAHPHVQRSLVPQGSCYMMPTSFLSHDHVL